MIAADLMSRSVIVIHQDAPLVQAVRLMVNHHISGLPVTDDDGLVVGMLTEGDLLRRVETGISGTEPGWFASFFMPGRLAGDFVRTHGRQVSEVMTPKVVTITEDTKASEAVALMQRRRVKRLPVLRGKRLVGLLSRADLVRAIGEALDAPPATADDATIRRSIMGTLAAQSWINSRLISVGVENGVVMLDGCVTDIRQRDAVGVVAENVPGVVRVDNRLVCIDLNSGVIYFAPEDDLKQSRTQMPHS